MMTKDYFDQHLPTYSLSSYQPVYDLIKKRKAKKILEIGSGDGRSLLVMRKKFGCDVYGIEQAAEYKKLVPRELTANIKYFSILDTDKVKKINQKFDLIIISRVLHHLVDSSPAKSNRLAQGAIQNSLILLNEKGAIIVLEPLFEPKFLNAVLFYIKKFITKLSTKRISLFGYWNNLGAPLVNFFTRDSLLKIFEDGQIIENRVNRLDSTPMIKLFFKRYESFTTIEKK